MNCDRCKDNIDEGEERRFHGQTLCEDCYIDALSPAKACDPWAVYSAKTFAQGTESKIEITATQSKILQILKDTGGTEPETIIEQLGITPSDLEREVATLRHMEKVRGELRDGKKIIRLW